MRVRFEPSGVTTHVAFGTTILAAAQAAGVEIEAICGGGGTCGKCRVMATRGVAPLTQIERQALAEDDLARGYRLACQAVIVDDSDVVVPEESRHARISILVDGVGESIAIDPWAKRHTLVVPPTDMEHQMPDWDNVAKALGDRADGAQPTLRMLQQLPVALRAQAGQITLTQVDDKLVRVQPGTGSERLLGIAFDIGTTTVVGYLLDLETGEQLTVSSMLNPQTRYGDDVVSRIQFSTEQPDGLATLQLEIVQALNSITQDCCATIACPTPDIVAASIVGNTTMHHLLLGISPAALAQAPYVPATRQAMTVTAEQLGLDIYPGGCIAVLPNIAGWVGADTVGVILATGIWQDDTMSLAIDIGTNGEMAMGSRERLITCSTAAGPAFEGAHLSCGMRAADGAIEWIEIEDDVRWRAIGDAAPRGLCGSGLVDVISEMLRAGVLQTTGMLQDAEALRHNGHRVLAERIIGQGRLRAFELVNREQGAGNKPVVITQRDVRELQLAKGAIRAGIEILMKELGIVAEQVTRVYLAGAFGNYIQPKSALGIGLIPSFPNAELVPVGNAAGTGAKMALLSQRARADASRLLGQVEYLELSGRTDFQAEFSEAMMF